MRIDSYYDALTGRATGAILLETGGVTVLNYRHAKILRDCLTNPEQSYSQIPAVTNENLVIVHGPESGEPPGLEVKRYGREGYISGMEDWPRLAEELEIALVRIHPTKATPSKLGVPEWADNEPA